MFFRFIFAFVDSFFFLFFLQSMQRDSTCPDFVPDRAEICLPFSELKIVNVAGSKTGARSNVTRKQTKQIETKKIEK